MVVVGIHAKLRGQAFADGGKFGGTSGGVVRVCHKFVLGFYLQRFGNAIYLGDFCFVLARDCRCRICLYNECTARALVEKAADATASPTYPHFNHTRCKVGEV